MTQITHSIGNLILGMIYIGIALAAICFCYEVVVFTGKAIIAIALPVPVLGSSLRGIQSAWNRLQDRWYSFSYRPSKNKDALLGLFTIAYLSFCVWYIFTER